MEKLGCVECKEIMKCTPVGGFDVLSSLMGSLNNVWYCENKLCKRVYLLAVGGVRQDAEVTV